MFALVDAQHISAARGVGRAWFLVGATRMIRLILRLLKARADITRELRAEQSA